MELRRVSPIAAKVMLAGSMLALAACGGHGPNSYLMPKDALVAKLIGAEREFTVGGSDKRTIRSISRNGDNINVRVSYGTSSRSCKVRVEAIDEKWTRATPECTTSGGATERFEAELDQMQVDEFVLAVLYDREIDSSMVLKRTSAVMIDNLGDVTEEVANEMENMAPDVPVSDTGWAEAGESDWGN